MPLVLGVVLGGFEIGMRRSKEVENRTDGLQVMRVALERMTRELRQAEWVYFSNSAVVDMQTMVRPAGGGVAVPRHVRYDCTVASTEFAQLAATDCVRREGAPTTNPPAAAPAGAPVRVLGGVGWLNVFTPQRLNTTTGDLATDYVAPNALQIRLRVVRPWLKAPLTLRGAVALRNRAT